MARLQAPKNLEINFQPSPKQMVVWKALMPECPICGHRVEQMEYAKDINGNPLYKPKCPHCGNSNIAQTILTGGAAGGGKALPLDAHVVTPFGLRKVGELKVGDIISSATTGGMQRIIQLHPIEEHEYYRVSFIDGTHVDCSEGHLWQVHQSGKTLKRLLRHGEDHRDEIMETKAMYQWIENNKNGMYKGRHLIIPLCAPVQFTHPLSNHKSKPIDPYILGALIGDGCFTDSLNGKNISALMTTMDSEIVQQFEHAGYNMNDARQKGDSKAKSYYIHEPSLKESLKKLGLFGHASIDKFIPTPYKFGTIDERKALICGLMDTDGYVDDRGHMSFTSVSKQLAEDVAFIVRSLGGKATIKCNTNTGYKNDDGVFVKCKDAFTVYIMTKFDPELVRLSRKKSRCKYEFNGGVSELGKRIVDIQPIGKKIGRCITVNEPCGLFVTDDFTVTHNSYLAACWLIMMCIRYEGVNMFVARTTLKSIRESTWKTIKNVMKDWGLVQDVHWSENMPLGFIKFWNDSVIQMVELSPSNLDPDYQRLGSSEYTGGYIEEAGEVDEKGASVLISRIRYKVYETTVAPKCLLGSNPSLNWIKSRFVYDDEGEPVECAEGDLFVPFTVYDNPNAQFRMAYIQNLMRIKDVALRERLLNGNWLWVDSNDAAAYWSFSGEKHLQIDTKSQYYDQLKPIVLSFDFNVLPYMSCLAMQFDYNQKKVYVFEEILGTPKEKTNNTPALARKITRKVLTEGHLGGLVVTGDPAGLARSTQTEENTNNFTILLNEMSAPQLHAVQKVLTTQPPQIQRLEFVNAILDGFDGWEVIIDMKCNKFKEDLIYQRKNQDGTKEKKKVSDVKLKIKYEKYGHLSDCFDYALCYFLSDEYIKFKKKQKETPEIVSVEQTPYNTFNW